MVGTLHRRTMLLPSLLFQVSVLLLACALEDNRAVHDRHLAAVDPSCTGFEEEKYICPGLPPCVICTPRHCTFAEWGQWSDMGGCHELCERTRVINQTNNECGNPCSGIEKMTKRCPKAACYSVKMDCAYSAWTAWNTSKCTNPPNPQEQQRRTRYITQKTVGANKTECKGSLTETQPCQQKSLPNDCVFSQWSAWSACSATCDTGYRHRERVVTTEAKHGGSCPSVALAVTEKCTVAPCNVDVDCVFSAWSAWNVDSAHAKQLYRSRNITVQAQNQGKRCSGNEYEVKGTEPGSGDCTFGTWGNWTPCSKSCGNGQTSRTRDIMKFSGSGACPATVLSETTACNTHTCGDECQYSTWSEWTAPPGTTHDYACSSRCGVGTRARHRVVSNAGRDCLAPLLELAPCTGNYGSCNLLQDCVWADWQEWSDCSKSCGNGTHTRARAVKTPPEKDGKPCDPLAKKQVDTCNLGDCAVCKDAVWGDWTVWTKCSTSCDTGFTTRSRAVKSHATYCGKPAQGPNAEYANCTGPPCTANSDCVVGLWSAWSTCSKTCFGITRRTRNVVKPASGTGLACTDTLEEMTACNPGVGVNASSACIPKNIEDCQLGDWQQWTQCTANCGGLRERNRAFLQLPTHGGKVCNTSALGALESCNMGACAKDVCVDCKWSAWKEWDACSMCKGQQTRTRHIEEMPTNCGKPCDERISEETRNCTGACPQIKFCVFSEWTGDNVSQCNAQPCGQNTFRQTRNMMIVDAVAPNQTVLSQGNVQSMKCNGVEQRTGKCAPKPCPVTCLPQDCVFGQWSPWEAPTCSGSVTRQRAILNATKCGGQPCSGPLAESKPGMAVDCNLPFDCKFSDWTAWTPCEGDLTAQRTSTRTIQQMPKNGGQGCSGSMMMTRGCNNPTAPKNCLFANWEQWSACPVTCNGDIQKRKRLVQQNAEASGELCTGADEEVRSCETQACPPPVGAKDCTWQPWSAWECDALTSQKTRTRTFLHTTPELLKGACIGEFEQIEPCNATGWTVPVWGEWSLCDKSCGGGQRTRTREGVKPPAGHDTTPEVALPKNVPLTEIAPCNWQHCPGTEPNFADCSLTMWTAWSKCSSSCGIGSKERNRTNISSRGSYGKGCTAPLLQIEPCTSAPCPAAVDCKWSMWSAWSACNAQCGGGEQTRSRGVAEAPLFGGKQCTNLTKEEVQPCNIQSCEANECVDGIWNDWGVWSVCKGANVSGMAACTTDNSSLGVQSRTRSVKQAANDCGLPVRNASREMRGCALPLCPSIDCKFGAWNEWSTCPGSCDGTKKRHRNITQVGSPDKACVGELMQITNCTPCHAPVPVDCKFAPWFQGECSVSCGAGVVVKTRNIQEEAKNGGKACDGPLKVVAKCEAKACNFFNPVDCLWGDWGPWGNCTKCGPGGQRKRNRDIVRLPLHAGKACKAGDSEQQEGCPDNACPKTYCSWGDWQAFGNCSSTCGNATKTRRRYLGSSFIAPIGGGVPNKTVVIAKYAEIRAQLEETESSRWKDLTTAFVLGAIACSVLLFAIRACGLTRTSPTYSQIAAYDNTMAI